MRGAHALAAFALCALAASPALAREPRLELDVRLDPAAHELSASARLGAPANSELALYRTLAVRSVKADGASAAFERAGREGDTVLWRIRARAGAKLEIEYGGRLPALDRSLGERSVLGAIPPMASSEGSYLPASGGWYPSPAERFSYRVTLSLPADQRGLVPGTLVAEQLPEAHDERYRATFAFAEPADGIDLMAGPYVVSEKLVPRAGAAPLRLRTYFTPEIAPLAAGYLDDSAHYIAMYSKEIGAYPFDGFSVVASPLPVGFGMPTLTYIGAQVLRLPFIRATSLGHEVLHNWWGNGVYPDYATGNWSEGLTTFMADYAYKERESAEAARAMRLAWLRDYAAVPPGEQGSLAAFRSRAHGAAAAVGYGKAAMVFAMLRDLIGEDAFLRGMREFWQAKRFQVASWADLRAAFERASGRRLGWFFSQWVERAGAPDLRIAQARAAGTVLALTLVQSDPPYRLRVPVEIAQGAHSEMRAIAIGRQRQTVKLRLASEPDGVRLDPDLQLWRILPRDQLPPILRQWILARAPRLVVAGDAPEVTQASERLAVRLCEAAPRRIAPDELERGEEPALVIGLGPDVQKMLAALGLPPEPASLAGRGSAQVWTVERAPGQAPVAVIAARDVESLAALERPLPHYGAQSYLAFEGARAIERGVWPAPGRLVPVAR
ncbi:MAG: M1 family aminopeptidase [Betaproteobacteria bacterium]|nr:M1 family aminopeptidase [Betaproteobacteria bacterium]